MSIKNTSLMSCLAGIFSDSKTSWEITSHYAAQILYEIIYYYDARVTMHFELGKSVKWIIIKCYEILKL